MALGIILCCPLNIEAQDIEPRRWSPIPLETKIMGVGYGYTKGDVFFDPILQAEDANIEMNSLIATYVQPFRIGKRFARFDAIVPFVFAHYEGLLNGEEATLNRTGFADARFRISLNLIGAPAGSRSELIDYFKEHPIRTSFGVSMAVTVPIGQYFKDKLINIGQNRFIFRPQFGLVHTWKSWSYELTGSLFVFTNNHKFFGENTRKQDPIFAVQTHLIKRFPSRLWASFSLAVGHGGESVINLVPKNDVRTDLLGALSVGLPISKSQNIKLVYLRTEATSGLGADTDSLIMGWSLQL